MKCLRPIFKKLEWLFLEEIPVDKLKEIKYLTEYEINHYEAIIIEKRCPITVREALDCIDFVVLHERDPRCYEYWPRIANLYKHTMDYLRGNTSVWEDPIYGQGNYTEERIKPRYEFKQRVLRGNAERLGFVVV